ncbi:MAG TPA: molybdopterin molybdotransferase MoeA [Galbitalea sp.]
MSEDSRPTWADARRLSYGAGLSGAGSATAASAGAAELVALGDAAGRRLARDVVALCDLPHYVSSAMDGWAVSGAPPWRVVDAESLSSGESLGSGECRAIVTGAALPPGATAVLRSEHAVVTRDGDGESVTTTAGARADEPRDGEHMRLAGTEATTGQLLIASGTLLNPAHVALAASAGHDELAVAPRPRVRLVLTGDEVVASGIPASGRVRDSFGPVLPSLIAGLGGIVAQAIHLDDSRQAMIDALSADPAGHELIVTTGSTGTSSADHLRPALRQLGADILIDGIRMRPGGPSLLARLDDGRFVVGLPGNPLAAILALLTLAEPLLAGLTGAPAPRTHRVEVGAELAGRASTSLLVPYRLEDGRAAASTWRGSAMMRGLADSDGVLVCPPDGIAIGASADAFALPWGATR